MASREKLKDIVDIELVAFPQSGMLIRSGTVELMDQALSIGADVVGGIDPASMDRDPKGHIDRVFWLAEKHNKPVDIHLHEAGELGGFSMELIIERTEALGMQNNVTVSHAFCLGMSDQAYVAQLIEQLAKAQVHIMTTGPASRPAPPVKALREAGVVVCAGSDGIRDTWGPYGNADMLERAMFLGLRNNFRRDDEVEQALDVCTYGGAQVMNLSEYGLGSGCWADLVLVEGGNSCRSGGGAPDPQAGAKARQNCRPRWRMCTGQPVTLQAGQALSRPTAAYRALADRPRAGPAPDSVARRTGHRQRPGSFSSVTTIPVRWPNVWISGKPLSARVSLTWTLLLIWIPPSWRMITSRPGKRVGSGRACT